MLLPDTVQRALTRAVGLDPAFSLVVQVNDAQPRGLLLQANGTQTFPADGVTYPLQASVMVKQDLSAPYWVRDSGNVKCGVRVSLPGYYLVFATVSFHSLGANFGATDVAKLSLSAGSSVAVANNDVPSANAAYISASTGGWLSGNDTIYCQFTNYHSAQLAIDSVNLSIIRLGYGDPFLGNGGITNPPGSVGWTSLGNLTTATGDLVLGTGTGTGNNGAGNN